MPWTELATPSALAVDLDLLKDHVRLTSSDEDGLLSFYAEGVTDAFERVTGRRLIERSFRLDLPDFPTDCEGIELPLAPVGEISHIKYYDTSGTLTTWDSGDYVLDAASHYPRVLLLPSKTYPTVQDDRHNGVQVTFTAGYGEKCTSVPKGIQMALMVLIGHAFANRLPVDKIPEGMARLVDPYRLRRA